MKCQIEQNHRQDLLVDDGMLFVRTESILETMVKTPLIVASLIIVALTVPLQSSFSSTRTLDITLYPDGSAHVFSQFDVDPLEPDFEVNLFGPSIDNLVAVGENGFLLSSEIIDDIVIIDTFGSTSITLDYDIHDLISKDGRVWSFTLDSPTEYSLLMPSNSIIVGMSVLPSNMELEDDQTKLELSSGLSEINYIFSTTNPPTTNPPTTNPPTTNPPTTNPPTTNPPTTNPPTTNEDFTYALIGIPIVVGVSLGIFLFKRKQDKSTQQVRNETISQPEPISNSNDTEMIFKLRPDMREDDKEIVKFIAKSGGEALESDLRKKFLQPRTTMWRAVKRLERQGVIEITKKDMQNLVKLKTELEEEE